MRQSDHEYEERSFGDIQRAIDFENSMNDLESQLYYRRLSPKEVAQQVLKATCQFYDADWCGLIQVDLDLNLRTPFWWFNTGATDKTMLLTEEYESAEFLDRWVQAVRKGIPMVVPDAEATKEAYPAEYDLYQRLGIRSVIAVSLEPRPVALLAVRNPKRYIQQTSMNDQPIQPGEGILHHAEGVDLIPANIELAGMEVALVNSMNREKMLKQVLDNAKREYDYVLLDGIPSLGMLTVNALPQGRIQQAISGKPSRRDHTAQGSKSGFR